MSIYDSLNDRQREAVFHTEGPLLILAGAGSGKTRVLTHRIAYLIHEKNVNPWNILAITFTNKAAGEMKERVEKLAGFGSDAIWVATFHSTCVRILRRYADLLGYDNHFTIYDTDDCKTVMKQVFKELQIDPKRLKEKTVLGAISSAKNEMVTPEMFAMAVGDQFPEKVIAQAYTMYQDILQKNNAMDFDDLLTQTVELFKTHPEILTLYQDRFHYIHVDEYQDTNTVQFEFVRMLAAKSRNLCVVGDDDQSIYKFRGANIRNILDFEKYFTEAKVIKLEQNYRSTQNILDAANKVIANNASRKSKALWTDKGSGELIHFRHLDTAYEEADYIAGDIVKKHRKGVDFSEIAILYRTNSQSRQLEEKLIREAIPYDIVGGINFYSRLEIKDVLAYLKTVSNGTDDLAVERIINVPKRGIGGTTMEKLRDFAQMHHMSLYEALTMADRVPGIGKASGKILEFVSLIESFKQKYKNGYEEELAEADEDEEKGPLGFLLSDILNRSGYMTMWRESEDENADDRIDNVEELLSKAVDFEKKNPEADLSAFLEEVALIADIDKLEEGASKVLLMTIHGAKGLEFPHVYLAGMEDGIFPSESNIGSADPTDLEEERRLCYVGITRAKENLTITAAGSRMQYGKTESHAVSMFVREIPEELMDMRLPKSSRKTDPWAEDYSPRGEEFGSGFGSSYSGGKSSTYNPSSASVKKPVYGGASSYTQPKSASSVYTKPAGGFSGMSGVSKGISAPASAPDYGPGDRVKHIKFGAGTVLEMEKGPKDYKVKVSFDTAGEKVMYAAFAKLEKI